MTTPDDARADLVRSLLVERYAETCTSCHATLVPRKRWDKQTTEERANAITEGRRRKARAGTCSRCAKIGGTTRAELARQHAERIEDLQWMADTGESLVGAARRLGLTEDGVEKFLKRAGEMVLLATLKRRNPYDANSQHGAAREQWMARKLVAA